MDTTQLDPDVRFTLESPGGVHVASYGWGNSLADPKGVVQLAHGMAEHALRYGYVGRVLNRAGYVFYAHDQRGHGATDTGKLGYLGDPVDGRSGWDLMVHDIGLMNQHIGQVHPGLPRVLIGHSLGSLLSQAYVALHGDTLTGLVLSAATGAGGIGVPTGQILSRIERKRIGDRGVSPLIQLATFGGFNWFFFPNRTAFDWLSRDPVEVDKYIADPLCGFPFTTEAWRNVFDGMDWIAKRENRERVPKDLPILLLGGSRDQVTGRSRSVRKVADAYVQAGVRNVECRIYDGARHELFKETNRDEIIGDVVDWLARTLPGA